MLESLLEALKLSPNNLPLKLQVARLYLTAKQYTEAEKHLLDIIHIENGHLEAKYELATCFYLQNKMAAAEILLEEVTAEHKEMPFLELLCQCRIKQGNLADAQATYQEMLLIDPEYENDDFDQALRLPSIFAEEDDFTDQDGVSFVKKPSLRFKDIGGMDQVKKEIALKIIKPLEHRELYQAYGKKIGGGILLYGPPGCGKTHLARATAGEIQANFISVGINEILDMWIGSSERNLHEMFETARKNKPCVIFIDEVDALGANRNDVNKSAGRTIINQFLAELDGFDSQNDGILIIGATNAPWHLDPAFRRPGRFDRIIFVAPPDQAARSAIFQIHLKDKPISHIGLDTLAKHTKGFSGADIQAVVDVAIEDKLERAFQDGVAKPLTTKDLTRAIKKVKPSTREWFSSARNYALYANDSGLYDDILTYLNLKK